MADSAEPRFRLGQPVQAAIDLVNDGSYPDRPEDALLVRAGERGEVVQIGAHVESQTNVYIIEFASRLVVGCLESEIAPLDATRPQPGPSAAEEGATP